MSMSALGRFSRVVVLSGHRQLSGAKRSVNRPEIRRYDR